MRCRAGSSGGQAGVGPIFGGAGGHGWRGVEWRPGVWKVIIALYFGGRWAHVVRLGALGCGPEGRLVICCEEWESPDLRPRLLADP